MGTTKLSINSEDIPRILGTVGSPLIVITELIKNAYDAAALNILVHYDIDNQKIVIKDDGDGFTVEDLENLSRPGHSRKKTDGFVENARGLFFTGSKGLGILSVFSLCEELIIESHTAESSIFVKVHKASGEIESDIQEFKNEKDRTLITLVGVAKEYLDFLCSVSEINKLKHISTYLYRREIFNFPTIRLQIQNQVPRDILTSIEFSKMSYDTRFLYDSKTQELKFQCYADGVSDKVVSITNFEIDSLGKIAFDEYGIENIIKTRTNNTASTLQTSDLGKVPSFEGRILVFEKQFAGAVLKEYGAGVNVYVNEFALYNYLSEENDWLGLADFSQRRKATKAKPHNTYGFVNFPHFDENVVELEISNERADFIQGVVFHKLMYLLKGVVMFFLFNIDVAKKNPKCKEKPQPDKDTSFSDDSEDRAGEDKKAGTSVLGDDEEDEEYTPEPDYKPKYLSERRLRFTKSEGIYIEKVKDLNIAGRKIYQIITELNTLDIQRHRYSVAHLYRTLLECASIFYHETNPAKFKSTPTSLDTWLTSTLIVLKNQYQKQRKIQKSISTMLDIVKSRQIVVILNNSIHGNLDVDTDFILETWKSMQMYITLCLHSHVNHFGDDK